MSDTNGVQLSMPISEDLAALRFRVGRFAASAGFSGQRLDDLVLAVNEAATNVLQHAGGAGTLQARADAHGVVVDVTDPSGGLTHAHLYQLGTPLPGEVGGFGLLAIRRLCDEVTLDHPGGQSRLRLHMRYSVPGKRPAVTRQVRAQDPQPVN